VSSTLPQEADPDRRKNRVGDGAATRRLIEKRHAFEPWLGGTGAFRVSEPALDHFPRAAWARLVARHGRTDESLTYGSPLGHLPLRRALVTHLGAARGLRLEAEQIMITSGSQQALAIAARVLLERGDPVWIEEPGYGGARSALAMAGARLVPVPVDEEGLDVAAGRRLCPRARAAYVTPSHQYPLGATMSAARRLRLLDWARTAGAWIVEDDYDSEYRYDSQPIAALQGLDREARVVYVGTFSKVLFPALRIGYLVMPSELIDRFCAVRSAMDLCPAYLGAAALAEFIAEGHFARHLRRTGALYRERRSALVAELRSTFGRRLSIAGAEAGMHLVVHCEGMQDRSVAERAARDGLWLMPLSACYLRAPRRSGLVLGFGGTDVSDMAPAVRRLRTVIGSPAPSSMRR
jgi:GntR family transcriptional regulator/MocR family aminotransferase